MTLQFADGAVATAVYNGYGYFSTMELISDVTEWGFTEPVGKRPLLKRTVASAADELEEKRKRAKNAIPASAPHHPHFGLTVVSCERGDIRQSPDGLYVYSERGREEIQDQTTRARAIWCSMSLPPRSRAGRGRFTTGAGASPIWKCASPQSSYRSAARRSG